MIFPLALFFVFAAVQSFGAVYYVSTDGNDDAAGSKDKPFASLNKANAVVKAGDTVWVRGGIYDLHDTVFYERYKMTAGILLTASGESDDKCRQLVCADSLLSEGLGRFGDLLLLCDPCSFSTSPDDGNCVSAGSCRERVRKLTDNVLFIKCLNERMLEGVRHKITAVAVHAFTKCVSDFIACLVAEALHVCRL